LNGAVVLTEKWPVLGRHEQAAIWLGIWIDLGRAPRTIDAYARGLAEYLLMCEREGVDPTSANRAHVAAYVKELTSRPHRRGTNVVVIDSGAGLSNATIQVDTDDVQHWMVHLLGQYSDAYAYNQYRALRQFIASPGEATSCGCRGRCPARCTTKRPPRYAASRTSWPLRAWYP
jgi:hypothetical protein